MPRGVSKPSARPEASLSAHRTKFLSSKSDSPARYLSPSVAVRRNHASAVRNLVSPQVRELAAQANPTLLLDGVQLTQVLPVLLVIANQETGNVTGQEFRVAGPRSPPHRSVKTYPALQSHSQ
jgi:hypothetical protein